MAMLGVLRQASSGTESCVMSLWGNARHGVVWQVGSGRVSFGKVGWGSVCRCTAGEAGRDMSC